MFWDVKKMEEEKKKREAEQRAKAKADETARIAKKKTAELKKKKKEEDKKRREEEEKEIWGNNPEFEDDNNSKKKPIYLNRGFGFGGSPVVPVKKDSNSRSGTPTTFGPEQAGTRKDEKTAPKKFQGSREIGRIRVDSKTKGDNSIGGNNSSIGGLSDSSNFNPLRRPF